MTAKELFDKIKSVLSENSIDNYENEAYFIIEKALNVTRTQLLFKLGDTVNEEEKVLAYSIAKKRISGIPIQYCIGEWDFFGETYNVGPGVLIPRPETEELCEIVINELKNKSGAVVFDLCSGSGCIGITVKNNVPDSKVYLVEKSEEALFYLNQNVEKLCGSQNIEVIQGDVLNLKDFDSLTIEADVIVSNPPYIKSEEIAELQSEVQKEPLMALDGGKDGYDFYRVICGKWHNHLKKGGLIAFECGENQAEYICDLFDKELFSTEICKDIYGVDRFVLGRMKA